MWLVSRRRVDLLFNTWPHRKMQLPGGIHIVFNAYVKDSFALSIRCKCIIYGRYSQFAWQKLRIDSERINEKKRYIRSATIIYFDVDMWIGLFVPNSYTGPSWLYLFSICQCDLYLFGLYSFCTSVCKQSIDWPM